jgi:rfaE bifunctional protein kinase chain/domain/rfaE bifunctional protein nucleotidyltransferase chain/domain
MATPNEKIKSADDLADACRSLQQQGTTVVQCHGCFDIVHPGHIRYLQFAKEQGDKLVVSVTGDDHVHKGFDRPYINEELRAENLAALEFVDFVTIDHHDWAGPVLETVQPDIYVKGKEYETKTDPRFAREKEIVEEFGGKVVFSSGDVVYSSSYIIEEFGDEFDLEQQKIQAYTRRHEIDRNSVDNLLDRFTDNDILVLGDPVLDHYIQCEESEIASEAPMLSVSPVHDEYYIGAGGLIARQMVNLGADATFLTTISNGERSQQFRDLLSQDDVTLETVDVDDRPIFVKSRYIVDDQKVFKVNEGRYSPASTRAVERMVERLEQQLQHHDALVVTDFGYGLFGPKLVDAISRLTDEYDVPLFVDVSGSGTTSLLRFDGPRFATPTESELRYAFGDDESGLSHLAVNFFNKTDAEGLILTLGKRGALVFYPPTGEPPDQRSDTDYLPAFVKHPRDPVGAGDVFMAALANATLADAPDATAAYLGTSLAALHVSRMGNDPIPQSALRGYLDRRSELM